MTSFSLLVAKVFALSYLFLFPSASLRKKTSQTSSLEIAYLRLPLHSMEKGGGGLTLDPKLFHGGGLKRKHAVDSGSGSGAFEFPISLNCREATPASSFEEQRGSVISEMDFFFREKKPRTAPEGTDLDLKIKKEDLAINTGLQLANDGREQSTVNEGMSPNEEDKDGKIELAAMQEKLGRMNEENQRLRGMLNQVTSNYNSLQMHFMALIQQRSQQNNLQGQEIVNDTKIENRGSIVPRQFMDLGRAPETADEPSQSSTDGGSADRSSSPAINGNRKEIAPYQIAGNAGDGRSGFVREESPENSSQGWAANKQPKLGLGSEAPDQAQDATMRKARVSVRARSEAPMITDGCQWRKYGQKMAKGNPCPRAYYRCTMATGCPVRKQVQRCAEDRSILITTYEGNHNHPLPPAAMAMASTTSAAASMLLSGSMPSTDGLMNANFLARTILPYSSSMATISASAPFPTVTLDLTHSPNAMQFQRPPVQLQVPFPGAATTIGAAALPLPQPPSLPQVFGQTIYNQSKFSGLQMSAPEAQHNLSDTVSAATAAITADPNFTAALAAAITSIIGGEQQSGSRNSGGFIGNNISGSGKPPANRSFPAT